MYAAGERWQATVLHSQESCGSCFVRQLQHRRWSWEEIQKFKKSKDFGSNLQNCTVQYNGTLLYVLLRQNVKRSATHLNPGVARSLSNRKSCGVHGALLFVMAQHNQISAARHSQELSVADVLLRTHSSSRGDTNWFAFYIPSSSRRLCLDCVSHL